MDWSLVLVSQGIESTIDFSEDGTWGLIVAAPDHDRALESIRLYRRENIRWPWRQNVDRETVFDWGSLAWVLLLCLIYWRTHEGMLAQAAGAMDGAAVARGEWWRLFTAMFLHADLGHLAANAGLGLVLLGLTMGVYGTGTGLLAALLAGAGGNLLTWLIDATHRSLGASGMVMGCVGLLAAQSATAWRQSSRGAKAMIVGLGTGVMLFLLLGAGPSPRTDLAAHLGGFVCGIGLGLGLQQAPRLARSGAANLFAGVLFSVLVLASWWLALRLRK
jgi:rhomboid protease GluP